MFGSREFYVIVFAVLGGFYLFFSNNGYVCGGTRERVSRVKADLRSMATAIESYYVDTDAYPAWSAVAVNSESQIPSFVGSSPSDSLIGHLTTPISYVSNYFPDPYTRPNDRSYAYWQIDSHDAEGHEFNGWIAWSPGPDEDYDLTLQNIAQAYDPAAKVPNNYLLQITYDPTNGEMSNGDLYRTKQ